MKYMDLKKVSPDMREKLDRNSFPSHDGQSSIYFIFSYFFYD